MKNTTKLEALREEYYELSRAFLVALQSDRPSGELEEIRRKIRAIVAQMEQEETPGSHGNH